MIDGSVSGAWQLILSSSWSLFVVLSMHHDISGLYGCAFDSYRSGNSAIFLKILIENKGKMYIRSLLFTKCAVE